MAHTNYETARANGLATKLWIIEGGTHSSLWRHKKSQAKLAEIKPEQIAISEHTKKFPINVAFFDGLEHHIKEL